ncbi:MAG: PAS domain S-box-containing protein [Oleiphilaceae bacterium]|jgi:PAS domain S-box-containing protein
MSNAFKKFLELIPHGLIILNTDGKITSVNTHLEDMFGFSQGELKGRHVSTLLPKLEQPYIEYQASINSTSMPVIREVKTLTVKNNNGDTFFVDITLRLLNKNATDILLTVLDVTDRESARESLDLSQQINKTGTWSFDLISNTVWWSPELFRIFNLPVSEEAPPFEVHHTLFSSESWDTLEPLVTRAAEAGIGYEIELELSESVGCELYAVARCQPQLNETGEVVRLVGTFQDVSSLKAAEKKLNETLLRLNESIISGGVGLWDWDLLTNKVSFSKEYKRQLGYTEDEFPDEYIEWESRIHSEDLEPTLNAVKRSIESLSDNFECTFRLKHKDSSYRWILAHGSISHNKDGQPTRMLGSHIDITTQKNMEEQLTHSLKMDAIGQLAGGVAHDFNNQLATIMGFAELIESSDNIEKINQYVKKIISATEHSANLTSQLLSFSRKDNLKLETLDIHVILGDIVELMECSIDKNIELHTNLNAEKVIVTGDKSRIHNAFLNIGLNARDAMFEGGSLSISTRLVEAPEIDINALRGSFIEIEFKDTGCGISKTQVTKIFDPFYTTKEEGKGTGLGLAAVYGILEQLGGGITVNSTLGAGTSFLIYLPLSEEDISRNEIIETQPINKQEGTFKTILIVDDDPMIREMYLEFIELIGHKGMLAENGSKAMSLYQEYWQIIDLVILDMRMPGMNGKELFLLLKEINPSIRAIIASGHTAETSTADMLDIGILKVIRKPFKLSKLREYINELAEI